MTPALALEHLMLHPRYAELVDELRALAPAHVIDQADAATTHAHTLMTTAAAAVLGADQAHATDAHGIPAWLRLSLLDTITGWLAGHVDTCQHNPTPERPEPVFAAAWRPALVVCARCVHLTALPRHSATDRTCDSCGHLCAGVDQGDGIYPGMVQFGPLVYQYGTCRDCRPAYDTNAPPSATQTAEPDQGRRTGRTRPRGQRGHARGRGHQ